MKYRQLAFERDQYIQSSTKKNIPLCTQLKFEVNNQIVVISVLKLTKFILELLWTTEHYVVLVVDFSTKNI